MSVVEEIKQRLDIVEVIGEYVPLQKAGRHFKGLCPFHTEKTPSFIVFPESQSWHCFGACSTGGDLFTFIMRRENMDFAEALRFLAQRAGVQLTPLDEAEREQRDELDRLREINRIAAEFYHHILMRSPQGEPGLCYLERRGVARQTMATFQLGYAPSEWHTLDHYLRQQGVSQEDALKAGLLSESEQGTVYDRFRGRVLFPIRDPQGRVIGFGGRVLDDSLPKYLNTPQTPLFDKGSVLYGIDLAREAIRESGTAVIVEGYMDVIIPYQCGVRNLVACMGTALTEAHMDMLKRITKTLVLALDPDAAGMAAVEKGVATAQEGLERRVVPVPTPQGLIRYEERLNAEIRILTLPEGLDPDELVLQDRERWDRLVAEALPVADHFFERARREIDVSTAKGKREAAERLLPILAAMTSAVERSHHLQRLAGWLRVDERSLWEELRRLGGSRAKPSSGEARPPTASGGQAVGRALASSADPGRRLEEHLLSLLLGQPALLRELVDDYGLRGEVFGHVENRQIFEQLLRHLESQKELDITEVPRAFDSELRAHVESLLHGLEAGPSLPPDLVREDIIKCATRLQKQYLGRLLRELRYLQQSAQEEGSAERVRELNETIERLRRDYREIDRRFYAATLLGRTKRGFQY
ncbi:MAG: DNA primase [Chloroflexi bacterium]|nr:DNA primase [Chloroflexota bacterium]